MGRAMRFEWDAGKEEINQRQHGISFDEAKELLTSGLDYLEIYDAEHSYEEDRFIAVGLVRRGLIVVVYTERQEDVIRIISARRATQKEEQFYAEAN
jgi:uncharacterized DUF497 family protein